MSTWRIHYVSGRIETIHGELAHSDRTLLKFRTTTPHSRTGNEPPSWITVVLANVETYRQVTS